MKIVIFLACLTGALAFSHEDIDYSKVVPIYETREFQEAFPELGKLVQLQNSQPKRDRRIWNGREAQQGELPYQTGIVILTSPQQGFCGGSIVSNNFVLSAAQCFPGSPNAVIEIGSVNRNTVPTFINAAQIIIHPSFDASLSANDLALVRTVVPIVFNENVRAVRLPNRRQVDQNFLNQLARVSGFGATGTGDSFPNQFLRVAFSPVISPLACTIRFPNTATVNTICIEGTEINFCRGDFGGPLTIQDADQITTQIGVASFLNILGCTSGFPGGFTRLSRYLDWIGANSDVIIRDGF